MKTDDFRDAGVLFFRTWWCTLLLIPFVIYSLHQTYWALSFNIFFAITYDFPFPLNITTIFVDTFLLIVHEAGHTFFSILGWRTLTILGGSLFQLIIPALILLYFWYNRVKSGIQLSLYLVGFSLLDISFYIADAGDRQLPLIGGLPKEAHDWFNLLHGWNALGSDTIFATCVAICAALCYLVALVIPAFFTRYEEKNIELNL